MKLKKILASALASAMLISSFSATVFAADLTMTASKNEVTYGQDFTITLPLNATKNVMSADFEIGYDDTKFTCESIVSDFDNGLIVNTGVNPIAVSLADYTAAKATGNLYVATFRVKDGVAGGDCDFTTTISSIKDVDGNPIGTYTVANATVKVKAPEKLKVENLAIDSTNGTATWNDDTNAADYTVVFKNGAKELYNGKQKAHTFAYKKYVKESGTYTVEVTANSNSSAWLTSDTATANVDEVVDATISITDKEYVTGSDGFDVVITPNGNTFEGIEGLTRDTDFTVANNVVHINDTYLATLNAETTLTFKFDQGAQPTLKVKVTKAADGATFILAERKLADGDSYFDSSKNDADTNANTGKEDGAIVIADPEAPVANLIGVQFTINNTADLNYNTVDYEIVPADGFALLYDEATGLYEINVKPVNGIRPAVTANGAGQGIVVGKLVYKGGYGKGTIDASNIVMTTEKSDNTYKKYDISTSFAFKYDIPEPAANLTVNVNLAKLPTKVDNVKAYQNMKLRVYSARLGFIDFDLGTDAADYSEKNGTLTTTGTVTNDADAKTYTLTLKDLPAFDKYTVFVSGDGYRDAKVQLDLNENTTVDFWNNANDSEIAQITKETSGIVKTAKKNFLAGDIIMNNTIDLYDLSAVSSYFGKGGLTAGDKDYIQYDLNRDGKVDIIDITMVLAGWAE